MYRVLYIRYNIKKLRLSCGAMCGAMHGSDVRHSAWQWLVWCASCTYFTENGYCDGGMICGWIYVATVTNTTERRRCHQGR